MYLRLITILVILACSEATFSTIASALGKMFGVNKCQIVPDPTSTDETYCGEKPKKCDPNYKYRLYDGSCNNLKHPWWGSSFVPYKRLVQNSYSDGVHKFPKTIDNKDLPNARALSQKLFPIIDRNDILWNVAFMQYGQIIAHDMSLTADVGQNGIFVACCLEGKYQKVAKTNPRCAPIPIPKNDPFYSIYNRQCINFYRTQTTHDRKDCKHVTKVAEPLTAVSGYIDASYIYGSSKAENDKLRAFKGGLLKFDLKDGIEYLTQVPNPTDICSIKKASQACFLAGDVRVNQNTQLTILHIIYLIHHNYCARKLAKLNPHWDDEKTFQEARKIVIAAHQHVFYTEMLPFKLGSSILVNQNVVYPGVTGYVNDYNASVDATPSNSYATAAFRVYHSEIQTILQALEESRILNHTIEMPDWMLRPDIITRDDNTRQLCRGMATQPQSEVDKYFTSGPKQYLFEDGIEDETYEEKKSGNPVDPNKGKKRPGDDLKAIDIMRGRDHGLGTYEQFVIKCCLGKLETWIDAAKFFSPEDILSLKAFYTSPKDIELVVGIGLEKLLLLALSGPVTACILAEQFYRSRVGDRFFYQNKGVFSEGQLKEIMGVTFGGILCLLDGIKQMQPRAFQQISLINPLFPCAARKQFDFSPWKDNPKH